MKSTHHPLVAAYLAELERLLAGADPTTRLEIVAGVREHLDASVSPDATDDEVRGALAALGSPHDVAAAAYDGSPAPTRPARRAWMSTTSVVLYCLTIAMTLVAGLGALAFSVGQASVTDSAGVTVTSTVAPSWGEITILLLTPLMLTFWLWIPAMVFAVMSPWWRPGEKALLILSPLVALIGIMLAVPAGYVAGAAGFVVPVLWQGGLVYVLITLARAASRRASTTAGRTGATR